MFKRLSMRSKESSSPFRFAYLVAGDEHYTIFARGYPTINDSIRISSEYNNEETILYSGPRKTVRTGIMVSGHAVSLTFDGHSLAIGYPPCVHIR